MILTSSWPCIDGRVVLIVLALVAAIGRLTADMVGTHHFGAGRHTWDIPPNYYNGYLIVGRYDREH